MARPVPSRTHAHECAASPIWRATSRIRSVARHQTNGRMTCRTGRPARPRPPSLTNRLDGGIPAATSSTSTSLGAGQPSWFAISVATSAYGLRFGEIIPRVPPRCRAAPPKSSERSSAEQIMDRCARRFDARWRAAHSGALASATPGHTLLAQPVGAPVDSHRLSPHEVPQ